MKSNEVEKSGPNHERLREARQRLVDARLAAESLGPGKRRDAALARLRAAEAEFQEACNPLKLALDYFPESPPDESLTPAG